MFMILLLTAEFGICGSGGVQYNADAAFDGTNFMTIWEDHRNGASHYHLYGARVTPDGAVLEPNGRRLDNINDTTLDHAIAWGGGTYLTVYRNHC